MSEANLVVIHSFATQQEADMAKSALESAGIEVMIQADAVGGMRPHVAWSSGGFKLLVREDDAEDAREVLAPADPL
jgi:putative signal transducing protein